MWSKQCTTVLALFNGLVAGVAFPGPAATPVVRRFDANGWTPKPTSHPQPLLELFRRQDDPSFCGYLEGDPESAVSCSVGRSCMYDEGFSWFGCCTGSYITDCNVITACVESRSISACLSDSDCYEDPLLTACTDRSEPYCMGYYSIITGETYGHFECAATDTTYEVMSSASDDDFSSLFDASTVVITDDAPTRTRFASGFPSRSASSSDDDEDTSTSGEDSETSTVDDSSSDFPRSTPQGTSVGTRGGSFVQTPANGPTNTLTTGAALRTAEAVLGAAGGVAGLLAILV